MSYDTFWVERRSAGSPVACQSEADVSGGGSFLNRKCRRHTCHVARARRFVQRFFITFIWDVGQGGRNVEGEFRGG